MPRINKANCSCRKSVLATYNLEKKSSNMGDKKVEKDRGLADLPRDLIKQIFSYLSDYKDQRSLMLAGKKFRGLYKSYILQCFKSFTTVLIKELEKKNNHIFQKDIDYLTNLLKKSSYEDFLKLNQDKKFEKEYVEIVQRALPSKNIAIALERYNDLESFESIYLVFKFNDLYLRFNEFNTKFPYEDDRHWIEHKKQYKMFFEKSAEILSKLICKNYDIAIEIIRNIEDEFFQFKLQNILFKKLYDIAFSDNNRFSKIAFSALEKYFSEDIWINEKRCSMGLKLARGCLKKGNFEKTLNLYLSINNIILNLPSHSSIKWIEEKNEFCVEIARAYHKKGDIEKTKEFALKGGYVFEGTRFNNGYEIVFLEG